MPLLTSTPLFHKKSKLIWFLSYFTFFLLTQDIFWIIAGLKVSFGWINDPIQKFHFVIYAFYDFGYNFLSKKIKVITYFCPFLFLSTCCLVSLINGHILYYRCLKKVQSNIFWGPKYGLTVLTAFSGKFQLNFCFYFSFCYLISFNHTSSMTLWVSREGVNRIDVPNAIF